MRKNINKELRYRDKVLRDYISKRTWDKNDEFNFIREFILIYKNHSSYAEFINSYKYFVEFEYDLGNFLNHKGDVILTDGRNNFLIVEFKLLWQGSSTKRTPKRKTLRKQIKDYMQFLNRDLIDAYIIGLGITDFSKPFYIEFLYYYDKIPEFFTNNVEIEYSKIARLPLLALCEFCKKHGYSEPAVIISDYKGDSFSDKYQVRLSVIIDNEELNEEKTGNTPQRIVAYLAAILCERFKIEFDTEYSKYYL